MEIATFFNSKGGDRKYNAAHWANYFKPLFKSGVFNGDLQVVANGAMSVTVKAGYAWLIGYGYQNTEPLVIDLEVASGNLNRYDAIKIKLDLSARTITAYADKGGNAASPAKPANTRSDTVFEITIAEVYIAAGTTVITQSMITDTRMDNAKCGWVSGAVDQIFHRYMHSSINILKNRRQELHSTSRTLKKELTRNRRQRENTCRTIKTTLTTTKRQRTCFWRTSNSICRITQASNSPNLKHGLKRSKEFWTTRQQESCCCIFKNCRNAQTS